MEEEEELQRYRTNYDKNLIVTIYQILLGQQNKEI
jgi:hypothetical protein